MADYIQIIVVYFFVLPGYLAVYASSCEKVLMEYLAHGILSCLLIEGWKGQEDPEPQRKECPNRVKTFTQPFNHLGNCALLEKISLIFCSHLNNLPSVPSVQVY